MAMIKTQISLPPGQFAWAKARAQRLEISMADVIRRLIDEKRTAEAQGSLGPASAYVDLPDNPPGVAHPWALKECKGTP